MGDLRDEPSLALAHEFARAGVHAPAWRARDHAGAQLVFLHVQAVLEVAAARAMHGETQAVARHQRARVQVRAMGGIPQRRVHVVRRLRAIAQACDIDADRLGQAEQLHGLVDQVRSQVVPQAAAGRVVLAPAVLYDGAEAVEVRMEFRHAPERAVTDQALHGEEIPVPAPVLEHADQAARPACRVDDIARFGQRHRERFVDHDMLALRERGHRQRRVRVVRRGDHHHVDGRIGEGRVGIAHDLHVGPVRMHLAGIARDDGVQDQAGRGLDQRRMEHLADETITDQGDAEGSVHA